MSPCLTWALVCAIVGAGVGGCGGDNEEVKRNEEILAELPTFPGTSEFDKVSDPYQEADGADAETIGHTTTITYEVPPGTTAEEVVDFYASRLDPDWRCKRERVGVLLLGCERGPEQVSVNTDNLHANPSRFDVVSDAEGAVQ
jgi:hypothetical protein